MRQITRGNHDGPADPEAYWRRRFFILGGGFGALMLAGWIFGSGGPSPSASRTAAAQASMAARESRASLPSTAYGDAWTGIKPSPSASERAATVPALMPEASPKATGSPKAASSGKATSSAKARGAGSGAATAAGGSAGARCAPGSIVLSLFTSEPSYGPTQEPRFDVYAVSTSSSGCELPFGSSVARVMVTRHGRVAWDSASCAAPGSGGASGTRSVRFTQGVPEEVALTWNRAATSASCAGSLARGESGTFDAVATADGLTSQVYSFKLLP